MFIFKPLRIMTGFLLPLRASLLASSTAGATKLTKVFHHGGLMDPLLLIVLTSFNVRDSVAVIDYTVANGRKVQIIGQMEFFIFPG